ncbi:MAG: GNAT family N-acetyltransferase [Pirellulaceae bacterium]
MKLSVRKITPEDNADVAEIIRKVMTEFGAVGAGFSIEDPEVDAMFEAYAQPRSVFYVVTGESRVLGCGGLAPLVGGDELTCELKKMYFLPEARGRGAGRVLVELLINDAIRAQFAFMYVETLERMTAANRLYQSLGFEPLDQPMGATGHCGCDLFYLLELEENDQEVVIG